MVVADRFDTSVEDAVIASLSQGIVEEMAIRLGRSAYTTFVRETNDFATGLATPGGDLFAYPLRTGVVTFVGLPLAPVTTQSSIEWHPGDVVITNDPFSTRGMVTHMNDIHFLRPIFFQGELLCFAWAFAHFTDVGGAIPGSIQMTNQEIFQEGLRLRPIKLMRNDVIDEAVTNILRDNTRIPEMMIGDLMAVISSLKLGEQRVLDLARGHGASRIARAMDSAMDQAEILTTEALRSIPDGDYSFVEYFEDDYVSETPIRLEVCVKVRDGSVEIDLSGCDPEVGAALNLPTGDQTHHPFLARAVLGYVMTVVPEVRFNAGIMRRVSLVLPQHSIVNAAIPAAVGMRTLTAMRIHDAVLGALLQAVPDRLPAGGAGHVVIAYVRTEGEGGGRVVVANPVQGGSGGSAFADGLSGCDRPTSHLRSVPAEVLEASVPVIVRRFSLTPDSEGAGQRRGGFGVEFELEAAAPGCVVVMRGKDRHKFAPWGALGGEASGSGTCLVRRTDGREDYLGKVTVFSPAPGETVVLKGPGGGGFGPAHRRSIEDVRTDVMDHLVSVERAEKVYGVVIGPDGDVDQAATTARRAAMTVSQNGGELHSRARHFDFGDARIAWEEKYGAAFHELQKLLWTYPRETRYYLKRKTYEFLTGHDGICEPEEVSAVMAGFAELASESVASQDAAITAASGEASQSRILQTIKEADKHG
jgi:N-methylhydantoinase B